MKIFPPALLGRLVTIPYYPLSDEMMAKIVRLQLGRIKKRVEQNHRMPFDYSDDAVVADRQALQQRRGGRPHHRLDPHQHGAAEDLDRVPQPHEPGRRVQAASARRGGRRLHLRASPDAGDRRRPPSKPNDADLGSRVRSAAPARDACCSAACRRARNSAACPSTASSCMRRSSKPKVKALAPGLLGKAAGVDILRQPGDTLPLHQRPGHALRARRRGRPLRHLPRRAAAVAVAADARRRLPHLPEQGRRSRSSSRCSRTTNRPARCRTSSARQPLRKRPYTVQYRESDFNFVSRLMEEEGHLLLLQARPTHSTRWCCATARAATSRRRHGAAVGGQGTDELRADNVITHGASPHAALAEVHAYRLRRRGARPWPRWRLPSGSARYPASPTISRSTTTRAATTTSRWATDPAPRQTEGKRTAQAARRCLRVEPHRRGGHHARAGRWRVGHHLRLRRTTRSATTPVDYLVTAADLRDGVRRLRRDDQPRFEIAELQLPVRRGAEGGAVPAAPRRPASARPRPADRHRRRPAGDEIHTDKYGRVKVQFHWDRDGKKNENELLLASASASRGRARSSACMALPRIGDEVVVELPRRQSGPPADHRPRLQRHQHAAVGRCRRMPPSAASSSRSSKGGGADNSNELRFDDEKGSEYVWFQAEKDYPPVGQERRASIPSSNRDRWSETERIRSTRWAASTSWQWPRPRP